jgi:FKBP-type peptidyl-prolyl cis-trans isomerase FkpA
MKNYSKILILALIALIAIGTTGCSKYRGYKKDKKTGFYYKVINQDKKAAQPVDGDFVEFVFTVKTEDSVIFENRHNQDQIHESIFKGDFYDALKFMHETDSISFILNGDSIYKHYMGEQVYPFGEKPLYVNIKLLKITPKEEYEKQKIEMRNKFEKIIDGYKLEEDSLLADYIKKSNIKVKPTESGLFFIKTASGKGKKIEKGSTVDVHVKLFSLDGQLLQSSYENKKPITVHAGQGEVLPGWDEAMLMMRGGDKAKLILPSQIAFGRYGIEQQIPPCTTFIIEIEIVNVQ